ncbi:tetratricopeptide repeat protein [Streptomyces sp. 35G-GA-8]|uniref:tetratricopeptide repeat protein n=1 Tax=Streptomyces sp. 35G-GA-8 TaxID=2939434 RepID=UPI00201F5A5C|nr:tetratricopeptide repeat protein [Streptomyces sp. 35G-GA-8]MCL7382484.1 tetratricopeptide repeat protein [Streptomyces sp. 35G-GA-8]
MSENVTGAGELPGSRQTVRAEGGFAYGVIGADIHVFGDGIPLYVLENWRPPPQTDPQWLQELPSRMLNARYAVVGFTGRESELTDLCHWRDNGPRLSARWLHGPGGQGKTRLADQFAAQCGAVGWKVVTATHGPGTVLPPPGSQDLRLDGARGLLLVVDYADRWPLTHLTWLLSNALLHRADVRTRILLLARTLDAWPAVRAGLANHQAGASAQFLEPLPSREAGPRAEMFHAACASFAARYSLTAPVGIAAPGPLGHPDFGLTLAVHIAALVAVDAHATGCRTPSDMVGLTIYLLDREHLHWARLYGDAGHELHPAERTYSTPPQVMNRTVFTAALTGSLEPSAGTAVLGALHPRPAPERVLADHAVCYPPADPSRDTVLEPLYPDRLAEDFLALTLPGHQADYPAQSWAAPTTTSLLSRQGAGRSAPTWTPRAITFLASAAQRWPHLGPRHLYPLLRAAPRLAIEAGSAALTALAALDDIDPALLDTIGSLFPYPERHAELDPGIAAFTVRLAEHWYSLSDDPAVHANISMHLALRYSNAGLHEQAVNEQEYAVAIYRRLGAGNAGAHSRDLGVSLYFLGASLGVSGRAEEALAVTEQAVAVFRRLAETDLHTGSAPTDRQLLAASLTNLGLWLAAVGRRSEGLAASQQAAILEQLDEAATGREASHAQFLHNHANHLLDAGRSAEALSAIEQAVAARQRLAEASPSTHTHDLADSLTNLGNSLASMGRREAALEATGQAVALYRRLAEVNPSAHEPGLANALSSAGADLAGTGRLTEAMEAGEEAVAIRRQLARANPAAHEPDLAISLSNLAQWRLKAGRAPEALEAAEEAVAIHRRLCDMNPAAYEPRLADSLNTLGQSLMMLGRRNESVTAMGQSVALLRRLAHNDAPAYEPRLGRSLHDLGLLFIMWEQWADAERAAEQAVAILRPLTEANPTPHELDLAKALTNLAVSLGRQGRWAEAAQAAAQPIALYLQQPQTPLAGHEGLLAHLLTGLGLHLAETQQWAEALEAFTLAVSAQRRLTETNPATAPDLATYLRNLGSHLAIAGQWDDAVNATGESAELLRPLTAHHPGAHEPDLAATLTILSHALEQLGRQAEARKASREAAALNHQPPHR